MTNVDDLSGDLIVVLAGRVDAAVADATHPHEVSIRLKLTEEEKGGPLGALAMAFDYMLGLHRGEFGAMSEFGGRSYPPDLKDVTPETWNRWVAVSQQVSTPVARARLNDLCFTGRQGNPGQAARAAAESYLNVASAAARHNDPARPMDQVVSLQRALTLARKVRDKGLTERALADTAAAARESLQDENATPGRVRSWASCGASWKTVPRPRSWSSCSPRPEPAINATSITTPLSSASS